MTEQNLQAVAFPKLHESQLAMLDGCARASRRRYRERQKLIEAGARDFTFFVVVSGAIEIVDESGEAPKTIAILRRGEFSGDVTHLTGGPSLISAVARGECDVYEVSSEGVREIINRFPDLGDVILQTFIARAAAPARDGELHRPARDRLTSGDGHLASIEIVNSKTGEVRTIETPALFSFIGAAPRTDWLPEEIERDGKDFVRTGAALAQSPYWTARRQPFLLETSHPGVFAAGDVRSGSVKRVASAVGEGSMSVQFVHEYLKEA